MTRRIAVVGGGLAGLFCAVESLRRGHDVTVFESAAEPGGIVRTLRRDGYALEPAAGTLRLPHPQLTPILETSGATVQPAAAGTVRYVFSGGELHRLAPGPALLATKALSLPGKVRLLGEALQPQRSIDGESLSGFARRRFGAEAGPIIADLMAAGVFGADAGQLSVASAFPRLVELEQRWGSILWGAMRSRRTAGPRPALHTPAGSMSDLVDSLVSFLGDRIRCNTIVTSVGRVGSGFHLAGPDVDADAVILAVPPEKATGLVDDGELGEALSRPPPAAPVAVVWLAASSLDLPGGFGYVTTSASSQVVLGCLFESSYAPHRAPVGSALVKAICGGGRNPSVVTWDDERLAATVANEVGRALGRPVAPEMSHVIRHLPGIPQYGPEHRSWMVAIDDAEGRMPGLHMTGWWYRGVGLSSLADDAVRIVDRVEGL